MKFLYLGLGFYLGSRFGNKLNGLFKLSSKSLSDFSPQEIYDGVQVELEHTPNIKTATQIALDHLTEDVNYYKKLHAIMGET